MMNNDEVWTCNATLSRQLLLAMLHCASKPWFTEIHIIINHWNLLVLKKQESIIKVKTCKYYLLTKILSPLWGIKHRFVKIFEWRTEILKRHFWENLPGWLTIVLRHVKSTHTGDSRWCVWRNTRWHSHITWPCGWWTIIPSTGLEWG